MVEIITGILADFAFDERKVKVDETIYPMTADAAKFCRMCGILKKSAVDIKLNGNREVCDIRPHKDPQPAPAQQQAKPSENRTSPERPAAAPASSANNGDGEKWIEIKGKLVADPDLVARKFTIKDVTDTAHPFSYPEILDPVMKKWKGGYYLAVKYYPDTRKVKEVTYWNEGKDEFAKARQNGGRRPFTPRNEKPPLLGCLIKCAVELKKHQTPPGQKFDLTTSLKECVTAAKDAMPDACQAAGVQ